MSPKSPTRKTNLEKLRERLSHVDTGAGTGFFGPKEGRNVIRILPPVGKMEYFFQTVGRHYMPPDNKKAIYCPSFTSDRELPCPICELSDQLRQAGDKKMSDELRVRRQFWMNVINRDSSNPEPLIYTPGVIVFGELSSLISDPDYGDITDVLNGYDIIIEKSGTGRDTEYHVKARPKTTPLTEDEDELENILSKARDLTYTEVSDDPDEDDELSKGHKLYLLPYDRIVRENDLEELEEGGEEESEEEEEESEEEEEEEKAPPKKHAVRDEIDFRRKRHAVKR